MTTRTLRLATRGSRLARWQTDRVASLLTATTNHPIDVVVVSTRGDRDQVSELHTIGGQGVFVKEVQDAVLDGRADLAVHSAKDLPAATPAGLVIGAFPERADRRDALVGGDFGSLRAGSRVGTGSVRRRAQLAARVPGLEFANLRGNIETRLAKVLDFDSIVVAMAALDRLGIHRDDVFPLDESVMVPQVGQGALAVECRADDHDARAALGEIDDVDVRATVEAERAFLAGMGAGCEAPVGASVVWRDGSLDLVAVRAERVGAPVERVELSGSDPLVLGTEAANALLRGERAS